MRAWRPTSTAIEPDTKDWTWVLERPCPECGFDAAAQSLADLPRLLHDTAMIVVATCWPAPTRDAPGRRRCGRRWSTPATSATCTCSSPSASRLMLAEDEPTFANWDQDETAVERDYGEPGPRRRSTSS